MEITHVMHTARSATIEIKDGGRHFTKQPYRVVANGKEVLTTEKTITSLFGLTPDTKYLVEIFVGEEKLGEVSFKTDYEYVTLDVTKFGAKGDGEHDDTQDDARTTSLLHPGKQFRKQEGDACCKNDKVGGVMG